MIISHGRGCLASNLSLQPTLAHTAPPVPCHCQSQFHVAPTATHVLTEHALSRPLDMFADNLGYKINLLGNAKIILGDGRPGSRTRLLLNRAETTGDDIATFAPRSLNDNTNIAASGFDYNCNLNWRLNGQQIAANPPCVSADVTIPTGAWYLYSRGLG